ncbi:MAG: HipA domain-containing protein [Proteobacteria bacterium]|nr:HipA domain-containing protein [Pseudomonadota bacterium]
MAERQLDALAVRLHGQRIGVINRLAGDNYLFSFDEAYVNNPLRPTLSLSFKGTSGGLLTNVRPYNVRLPPFYSNLLPEGHLREYLAARAGVKVDRDFFLLAILGSDLPGAISVTPVGAAADDRHGDPAQADHGQQPMRFSLAGVQLKFSAVMEASGGLTIQTDGLGGAWILKLPSVGIPVPNLKLVPLSAVEGLPRDIGKMAGSALAVQRFDRTPEGGRIHMEDFAQVFGIYADAKYSKRSYANIAQVLSAESGDDAVMEFTRRLTFSVLIGNADMHLKNWSLLYLDRRTPSLAPAYDYVSTVPYLPNDRLALGLGGSKELTGITQDQIRRFADTARLAVSPLWRVVQETTEKTVAAWQSLDEKNILPAKIRTAIDDHMAKVAASIK